MWHTLALALCVGSWKLGDPRGSIIIGLFFNELRFTIMEDYFNKECKTVSEALSSALGIQLNKAQKADLGLIGLYYGDLENGIELGNNKLAQRGLEKLKRLLGELLAAKAFFAHKNYDFSEIVKKLISNDPVNSLGVRAELMMLNLLLEDYFKTKHYL